MAVIALFLLGAWLIWSSFTPEIQSPTIVSHENSPSNVSPTREPKWPSPVKTLETNPLPKPEEKLEHMAPPKGSVTFQVKKGLVIAFGDMVMGRPTKEQFPERGILAAPPVNSWKTNVIPFAIHQDLPNPERVLRAIEYFNNHTAIQFVPLTDQTDSIVFAPSDIPLCLSFVGKVGGHQPIYLDDRCGEQEIMHEMMHALGFAHEHSRPDRDNYVTIRWQNIDPDKYGQFEIVPDVFAKIFEGRPFDASSIMIYESTAFARSPGDITIEPRTDSPISPVKSGLSAEDIERLRILSESR